MMEIKSLAHLPLKDVVDCFLEAFSDYMVKMPTDLDYWAFRFRGARVEWDMSFGMFDNDQLVGFFITGIDQKEDSLTAFNTGTGVIPAYRGKKIVDQLYAHAIPIFKERGCKQCVLEVIQSNPRAIRVYERIGFHIVKNFPCYMGDLHLENIPVTIEKVELTEIFNQNKAYQSVYSWDFVNEGIQQNTDQYTSYYVKENEKKIGYFIINESNGTIGQYEIFSDDSSNWKKVFSGINQISSFAKMNNVDGNRTKLIEHLEEFGLKNHISQYEMLMKI